MAKKRAKLEEADYEDEQSPTHPRKLSRDENIEHKEEVYEGSPKEIDWLIEELMSK